MRHVWYKRVNVRYEQVTLHVNESCHRRSEMTNDASMNVSYHTRLSESYFTALSDILNRHIWHRWIWLYGVHMYSMSANPISYASQTPILYVTYQTRLNEMTLYYSILKYIGYTYDYIHCLCISGDNCFVGRERGLHIYIYVYIYTHAHIFSVTHTHTYTLTHTHIHARTHTHTHTQPRREARVSRVSKASRVFQIHTRTH